ncbi:uncharacterized protein B0H64DRAFT_369590 [Chaetomium fimeti]|uniref:Uncharacterized protein n=1 Tax=Chaetomium fimeti TaxID=1854472 RepID=A0AAE0HPM8_9PEZI|nr:hypothetical protein B0H64DRAFT_369590 [Chaetomium fimeti]
MRPLPRQTTSPPATVFPSQISPASSSSTAGDDTIVPAVCYDVCNNAYRVSAEIGLVPELCAPESPFRQYRDECVACLEGYGPGGIPGDFPLGEAIAYCNTNPTPSVDYTIPTSWLTNSTTLAVITVSGIIENDITGDKVYTIVTDVLVTRSDWTGFDRSTTTTPPTSLTTGVDGIETGDSEPGDSSSSGGSRAWIAGPVIGGVAGLAILVGIYFFFARRRKRPHNVEETWSGKPELPAESAAGPPKTLLEVEAESRPPQELDGAQYTSGYQQTHGAPAELAANEVAAREMDVKSPGEELGAESLSRPPAGNI